MPLHIIRQDITKMKVDAIVNPSNTKLIPGGGTDAMVHAAAGHELFEHCQSLGGCEIGRAKASPGFNLKAGYVIHTAGPKWKNGLSGEEEQLKSCYKSCLEKATELECESVAFPLISSGTYGFPKDKVLRIAVDCISAFLFENELTVYLVVFDKEAYTISEKLFAGVREYIDDNYISDTLCSSVMLPDCAASPRRRNIDFEESLPISKAILPEAGVSEDFCKASVSLEDALKVIDESFSQMLLRKIDEKGIKDSQCYKKANIDKKLFSKIRTNIHYKPKKSTVLAFAVALELSLDETNEMLNKAGYALTHSEIFDIIVEYFISQKIYDIFSINEVLFKYDQVLLGSN